MKYVVSWTLRSNGTGPENEAAGKRLLEIFGKWSPSTTVLQFVSRVDGNGGFSVNEADDVAGLARDLAIFAPYLDFTVHPVQDIDQAVGMLQEAIVFRDSV